MLRLLPSLQTLRRLHPFRAMDRTIFFVEKLCLHSVWVTLHRERAIFQMRKKHRRDANVVIDDLTFGEAGLRIQNLVQVRNRELFSFNN